MLNIEMDLHSGGESHGNLEQGPVAPFTNMV